jgi:hypothetical protein
MLHDEAGGLVEVRDVMSGALVEVVQYKGLTPIPQSRAEEDMLCLSATGLTQIVEVSLLARETCRGLERIGRDQFGFGEMGCVGRRE